MSREYVTAENIHTATEARESHGTGEVWYRSALTGRWGLCPDPCGSAGCAERRPKGFDDATMLDFCRRAHCVVVRRAAAHTGGTP
jgi:hypothetical protein